MRAALDLGERETLERLIVMIDAEPPGRLPPMLRAERSLVASFLLDTVV